MAELLFGHGFSTLLVRGRTRSKETWRTYGEALYDWWQTLEANAWARGTEWDLLRLPQSHTRTLE
jgi:hypothetical protein